MLLIHIFVMITYECHAYKKAIRCISQGEGPFSQRCMAYQQTQSWLSLGKGGEMLGCHKIERERFGAKECSGEGCLLHGIVRRDCFDAVTFGYWHRVKGPSSLNKLAGLGPEP